jgi:D-sedoheptulose 7-phosphate isomerase
MAGDDAPEDRDDGMQSLYPFLYTQLGDFDALLEEVRRSTVDKAVEIADLRRSVLARERRRLTDCARAMADRFAAGGKLLAFGNGGSSTDAQDLASLFVAPPGDARPLPAFSLTADVAVLTSLANDIGFEVVFARQIAAMGAPVDIAVGLSTSGNSENLLRAFESARRGGLLTVGLAGYDGGRMAEVDTIDHLFVVPSPSVHRIQEAQTTLYHVLWELTLGLLAGIADRPSTESAPRGALSRTC